ncbi:MAG: ABC transporter permease [Salinivirgaceae bacterium]|nr:ABC transporter permease [Salinivirgaceae bacterium]MDY0281172.1 ABC transporter permease [Salinivirgaceae bacterium]
MHDKTKPDTSNILAYVGICIIVLFAVVSFAGYLITPDNTPNTNSQHPSIALQPIGFRVAMLKVKNNVDFEPTGIVHRWLFGEQNQYRYIPFDSIQWNHFGLRVFEFSSDSSGVQFEQDIDYQDILFSVRQQNNLNPMADSVFVEMTNGQSRWCSYKAMQQRVKNENLETKFFAMGTDRFGRDMLSRLIIGGRISLSVGFVAVFVSLIIGIFFGLVSGYYGGIIDKVIVWLINVFWSVPTLLLVIAVCMALGKGFWQIFLAIGLTMWVEVARVVRGKVLQLKHREYIEAAKVLGFSDFRIMFRHLLPNIIGPILVISAANFASAILIESGLSFLGVGIEPPTPTWGAMIRDHYGYIIVGKAWLAMAPGFAVMIMVWAFTVSGHFLRRRFNVD